MKDLTTLVEKNKVDKEAPNLYPIYKFVANEDLTVHLAYLRLADLNNKDRPESFLFESSVNGDSVDRYSFIGIKPRKIIRTGDDESKYPPSPK